MPNFCSFIFLFVCVFRASFLYLYPIGFLFFSIFPSLLFSKYSFSQHPRTTTTTGTFEFEPLSYFVVFEIPTFLLFSVLIFMIYSFKRLVYKRGFFPGNPTPILIIGWSIVWILWVIVTVVYSEVILGYLASSIIIICYY